MKQDQNLPLLQDHRVDPQLNGDALKSEAQAEMEKLEQDVATQVAGGVGYSFTIG